MKLLDLLRVRIASLFQRSRMNAEVEEELRSHIQLRADGLEGLGLSRKEAERRARIEFGGRGKYKEECQEALGANFIETFLQDARFSVRVLRKSPGFTIAPILTLALAKRVLKQLFTEAVLLSIIGGAVGLAGSVALLRALSVWQPFPRYAMRVPVDPDAKVYVVAVLLTLMGGLLFGAVPVKQILRTNPYEVIKSGAAGVVAGKLGRRITLRDLLLVTQIAICAVLVTSSMVAVRGLVRSLHSSFGFEPRNATLANTDLSMAGYSSDRMPAMQKRMIEAMETISGVSAVGLVGPYQPLTLGGITPIIFTDQTTDIRPANAAAQAYQYNVTPEYLHAAATALLAGRQLSWHEDQNSPRVAVVNRQFAVKMFGSMNRALGGHYKMKDGTRVEVVGIVEDGKYFNLAENPQLAMFLPILQWPTSATWLVVRSERDPLALTAPIRNKIRELDAGLPVYIQPWSKEMEGALFASRVATLSLGVLGVMGAMLSITGIFGMAAYSVSKRLKELGIRIALGARRREVLEAALARPFKLLAIGSIAGLLLGLLATKVLALIVYQATPRDPLILSGVVLAMLLLGPVGYMDSSAARPLDQPFDVAARGIRVLS